MKRNRLKLAGLLLLVASAAFVAFTPKKEEVRLPPPADITDITVNEVHCGAGSCCHVPALRFVRVGGAGATSYVWEVSTNGGPFYTQPGSGFSILLASDGTCVTNSIKVTAVNSSGSSATYGPVDFDNCTPYDICLADINKKLKAFKETKGKK